MEIKITNKEKDKMKFESICRLDFRDSLFLIARLEIYIDEMKKTIEGIGAPKELIESTIKEIKDENFEEVKRSPNMYAVKI